MGFAFDNSNITLGLTSISTLANGSVSNIAANTLTTVVTHTASGSQKISKISFAGTGYARFFLVLNTATIDERVSGPDRTGEFTFGQGGLSLSDSDILDVKVRHVNSPNTYDFNATIYGA